jgi:hypothetical protein
MSLIDLIAKGCKFVDETCAEIRRRFGFRTLEPAQRRKVQGQWFKNGVEIARRAAHCLDLYARYLPGVPYKGDDIRDKAARVATTREVWVQLDLLARQARDTYLIERSELHAMSMGVRKALEATSSYPFLPEGDRQNIQAGIATLRAELDEKNRKISRTKKAASKLKAEARTMAQAELERMQAAAQMPAPAPLQPPPQPPATPTPTPPAKSIGGLRPASAPPRRTQPGPGVPADTLPVGSVNTERADFPLLPKGRVRYLHDDGRTARQPG